jgi:hypothetical protein
MTTVMCMPNIQSPQQCILPACPIPNISSCDTLMSHRIHGRVLIPSCPPSSRNCGITWPSLAQGARTPVTIDSGPQTVVTEPSPRRRLHPSHPYSIGHCAHSATQGSTSVHPVVTPHCHKIQSSWCSPSPQADETGSSPKGTYRADRSPTPPASFSRPRHMVDRVLPANLLDIAGARRTRILGKWMSDLMPSAKIVPPRTRKRF